MANRNLSRRNFIQMAIAGSGSLLLLSNCTGFAGSYWRFFTTEEGTLVDAIVEQIIPTDEWPGAKDAGCTNYIDKQLVGPLERHQEKYRKGLAAIKTSCQILYKKQFESISWDKQTEFLKRMESGKLAQLIKEESTPSQDIEIWEDGLEVEFFRLIREHTMQGYYGSPRHGGNKNYVSYQMVGLDYPFIVGQNRYKS